MSLICWHTEIGENASMYKVWGFKIHVQNIFLPNLTLHEEYVSG